MGSPGKDVSRREQCAELDAIPASELRDRVETAIVQHIPADEWARLQRTEALERAQWQDMLAKLGKVASA